MSGFEALTNLDSLNLTQNFINKVQGLESCLALSTLQLKSNRISDISSLESLKGLPKLSVLDLSDNKLDDPAVLDILAELPELKVLYLKGNPVVDQIESYRRTVLSRLRNLKYLDDRPVFEDERRAVTAWAKGMLSPPLTIIAIITTYRDYYHYLHDDNHYLTVFWFNISPSPSFFLFPHVST